MAFTLVKISPAERPALAAGASGGDIFAKVKATPRSPTAAGGG